MKTLVICSDCFGNDTEALDRFIKNISDVQVLKSHCMGVCPKDKISTLTLQENKVNEFEIRPLTIEELKRL